MNILVPVFALSVAAAVVFVPWVLLPRLRMERRARALLALHPGAERTSVYLRLRSTFAPQKQREIDIKVAEMQLKGWTFLRAREANPLRTICSWGGGLTLDFIRTPAQR